MAKKKQKYIYVKINEQTVFLMLICNILCISKYQMFLLYETFGNDVFLFFDILQKADVLKRLTQFRIRRYHQFASAIASICLGKSIEKLSTTELRAYRSIADFLFEDKFKIPEDETIKELE